MEHSFWNISIVKKNLDVITICNLYNFKVFEKRYSEVVVFEDDLRFEPYFRTKLRNIMEEVAIKVPDWDLM